MKIYLLEDVKKELDEKVATGAMERGEARLRLEYARLDSIACEALYMRDLRGLSDKASGCDEILQHRGAIYYALMIGYDFVKKDMGVIETAYHEYDHKRLAERREAMGL